MGGNSDNKNMTEQMLWAWARFAFSATGVMLPINYLDDDSEEVSMIIGFECPDGGPPLTCSNGRVVRRLALSFPYEKEEIQWH